MKRIIFIVILLAQLSFPGGILLINPATGQVLKIESFKTETRIENQVSITTVTSYFKNTTNLYQKPVYIFPIPEGGSAIRLRWEVRGIWYEAGFSAVPQDSNIGGGGYVHPTVTSYAKPNSVIYPIPDSVGVDSTINVELTYVEFLKYDLGEVLLTIPTNLPQLFCSAPISQSFKIILISSRHVDSLYCFNRNDAAIFYNGDTTSLVIEPTTSLPVNLNVGYRLSSSELGLFSFSTYLTDSTSVADSINGGYFLFVAEPSRDTTMIINKRFTLIIDRSGSMSTENKMAQAKNAASFIVERLNEGDLFNLIEFDDYATSFRESHVIASTENKNIALTWISNLTARGMTNISGVFSEAVPDFYQASDSTANIILFLTDGLPTAGITHHLDLLAHIQELTSQVNVNLSIFTFGVGSNVNRQLLQSIANNNSGLATFLLNNELEPVITKFYLKIQNPVLITPTISFSPNVIEQTHPTKLPNLYIGEQLLLSGRYWEAPIQPVTVTLSGKIYGQPVSYNYPLPLMDSAKPEYLFLTKIWAKLFIEDLLSQYYSYHPNSTEALAIKAQIISLSLRYGVITVFTSFGSPTGVDEESPDNGNIPTEFALYQNYPNPFNPSTTIEFAVPYKSWVTITIYDMLGRVVAVLIEDERDAGNYRVVWNASSFASGTYIVELKTGNIRLTKKLLLLK
jgi:Ca-activated chloride channel family protein